MAQIIWLLAWTNKNYDHQLTALAKSLLASSCVIRWKGGELEVTNGQVASGEAFILCTRTNGQEVMLHFNNTEVVNITTTGTKKVYVLVDQAKLDDGSSNALDGSWIASIQTGASYPSGNYIPLASITGGTITDAREFVDTLDKKLDVADYQNGSKNFAVSATGTDAYEITLSPAPTGYTIGMTIRFQADVVNTDAATLNVNGLWAKTIKKQHDKDLLDGDIEAGQIVTVTYDWTNFEMDSQVASDITVNIYWDPDTSNLAWEALSANKVVSLMPDGKIYQVWGDKRDMGTCPGTKNVLLDDGRIISMARSWSNLNLYVWTVTGNSVSFGSAQLIASNNYDDGWDFCKVDTNKLVLAYNSWQYVNSAVAIDITTWTPSMGAVIQIRNSWSYWNWGSQLIAPVWWAWVCVLVHQANWNWSAWYYVQILSVSGTTLAVWWADTSHVSGNNYQFKHLATLWSKIFITWWFNASYDYSYLRVLTVSGTSIASQWQYDFPAVSGSNREYWWDTIQKMYPDSNWTDVYVVTDVDTYWVRQFIKFTLSWNTLTRWNWYQFSEPVGNMIIVWRIIGHWSGTAIKWYLKTNFSLVTTSLIWITSVPTRDYISNNYIFLTTTTWGKVYKISNEIFYRFWYILAWVAAWVAQAVYRKGNRATTTGLTKWGKYYTDYSTGNIIIDDPAYPEVWMALSATELAITI